MSRGRALTGDREDKVDEVCSVGKGATAQELEGEGCAATQDQRVVAGAVGVEVRCAVLRRVLLDQQVDMLDGEDAGVEWQDAGSAAACAVPVC